MPGDLAAMLPDEEIDRRGARPGAKAVQGQHLASIGEIKHDRRHTCEIDAVRLQDAHRNPRGHAGVDRVAAGFKDGKTGVCRRMVTCGNHVARAGNGGAVRRHGDFLPTASHAARADARSRKDGQLKPWLRPASFVFRDRDDRRS
jgi:hypothetical protein